MAPLFVLWSFLFLFLFNELQASWNQNSWRENHTFYYYANEQKPSVTISTGPVHPSILQGAYDCYEQSYMVPYHVIKITCSALRITYDRLSRIDYKTITTDSIKAQFDELYESVCNIDGPELVRQSVALSTQILIDGKAAHACNAASKQALSFLAKEVRHIKKARSLAPQFALAGDARMPNILLHASEEESLLQKIPHGSWETVL